MDGTYWRFYVLAALVAALSLWAVFHIFPFLLYVLSIFVSILLGALLAVFRGSPARRARESYPLAPRPAIDGVLSRVKLYPPPTMRPMLFSSSVDARIKEVLDLTLRHHLMPTYRRIARDEEAFFASVLSEAWSVLAGLLRQLQGVDTTRLATQDVAEALRAHFEHFHGIHFRDSSRLPKFPMLDQFPYLESREHELEFLRQACEVLLCVSLPKALLECSPVRVLLREYLACQVVLPTIDVLCDPDYLNLKLLGYLQRREEKQRATRRKGHYETFEDFMKQVKRCDNTDELLQMREFIITEIVQAKAVKRMKLSRATGIQGSHFPIPISAEKARVLMQRDLTQYIAQLSTAKTLCERKLREHSGMDYDPEGLTSARTEHEAHKVTPPVGVPFDTLMQHVTARQCLQQFLDRCGFSHLLLFWEVLEELQGSPPDSFHKGVRALYEGYLSPSAPNAVYTCPEFVESVRQYLEGEGADCSASLLAMQESIWEELHEQFYESFISSEEFRAFLQTSVEVSNGWLSSLAPETPSGEASSLPFLEEGGHKHRLQVLQQQLKEKEGQLAAMPEGEQSSSLAQRRKMLRREHSLLEDEVKRLEHYIDHTEEWFCTIGQWSIDITSVDLSKDGNHDKDPLFVVVVHRSGAGLRQQSTSVDHTHTSDLMGELHPPGQVPSVDEGVSETKVDLQTQAGWVVGRRLSEFEDLHSKVSQVCPGLHLPSLPVRRLNPLARPDAGSKYWRHYRHSLQLYLETIMQHKKLQESEEVFNFLSPASEHLRKSSLLPPERKRAFHLLSMPAMFSSKEPVEDEGGADRVILLMREVFELDEWSKVWRKQLMELAQLTFGRSLDRELHEFMSWIVSEPMLIFYIETFRDAMWPGGQPAPPTPTRSDEEKARTKDEAKQRFIQSSPQSLMTVLGQRNCQIGFVKIFEGLQDCHANRQLFYSLFELFLTALVPELADTGTAGATVGKDRRQ